MSLLEQRKIETPYQADEGYFNEFYRRVQSRVGLIPQNLESSDSEKEIASPAPSRMQFSAQLKVEFGQAQRPVESKPEPKVEIEAKLSTSAQDSVRQMGKENIEKIEIAPLHVEPNPTPSWRNFAAEWSQEETRGEESASITPVEQDMLAEASPVEPFQEAPSTAVEPMLEMAEASIDEPISQIAAAAETTQIHDEQPASTTQAPVFTVLPNEVELARLNEARERQERYERPASATNHDLKPAFAPITGSNRSQLILNSLGVVASLVAVMAAYFIWQGIQRPVTIDEYVDTSLASRGVMPLAAPIQAGAVVQAVNVQAELVKTILEEESIAVVPPVGTAISIEGLSSKGQRAAQALESYNLAVFDDPNPFFEETEF